MKNIVKLTGISKKGRERVKQHGDLWRVKQIRHEVVCLNNEAGMLVESLMSDDTRWVKITDDPNFNAETVDPLYFYQEVGNC